MATWTHFTTFLDGSRIITKAEQDELLDRIATRLIFRTPSSPYLDSADIAAIKGSKLITDRARLFELPGPTSTTGRWLDLFAIAAPLGGWHNYSSRVTAALSHGSLTSTQRDALTTSGLDAWKLWNYYRHLIEGYYDITDVGGDVVGPDNFGPYDIEEGSLAAHSADVTFTVDGAGVGAQMLLKADGVDLWNSGCTTTDASTTVTVPAGTAELSVVVTTQCSGSGWDGLFDFRIVAH